MAFRTGYEGLAGAVQGAFDTYYRRKEGQEERGASMERLRIQLDAAKKEGDTQRAFEIQQQINEHTRAKELKGMPSIVEHKGATDAKSAMYGDIATTIDGRVEDLLPILQSAEDYDDFIEKSGISSMFPDKLDKDEFTWLQQNRTAAAQYLKRNIAEYSIPRSNLVKAQQQELTAYLGDLGYTQRVDWTPYYEWYDEQQGLKAEKKAIKDKRADPLKKSELGEVPLYPKPYEPTIKSQSDFEEKLKSIQERQTAR